MVLSAEPGVRCLMMEPMRSTAIVSVMYAFKNTKGDSKMDEARSRDEREMRGVEGD